jgi:predicted CXXCH cytochrome family protein
MQTIRRTALLIALLLPPAALAAGKHDAVGCKGCHLVAKPNRTYANPATGQPYTGATALCFACHQEPANGGRGNAPISQHVSHPFDLSTVNPRVARVPADLLRDGRFTCMSCHDPHPSNPNYRYLRADVGARGEKIDRFCGFCHLAKTGAD